MHIREANESDVDGIGAIFHATYGQDYTYPQYYDPHVLKKLVFSDDTLLMVAEDPQTKRIAGTASVILQMGAQTDLVGEFGRLAVHPDFRGRGIGKLLMAGRLERVQDQLHLGLVEPRVIHPYSQRIVQEHGFAPIGFLPLNLLFDRRESAMCYARFFQDALKLRRNNPRIIPEAHHLAEMALSNCGIGCDAIVDDLSSSYPHDDAFELEEMQAEGYTALLRMERGRVRHREVFGPMRLHYGLFKLRARKSQYLVAWQGGRRVGAVGFIHDKMERAVRIFELISESDAPLWYLLGEVGRRCETSWRVEYIEVDASAYAPRMQRTLLGLGYLPIAYVPAMVFHDVERLDAVKMARLLVPPDFGEVALTDESRPVAEAVMNSFTSRAVLPRIAETVGRVGVFRGLSCEQVERLAGLCTVESIEPGERVIAQGECDGLIHLVLSGSLTVSVDGVAEPVGRVQAGECVGELSFLESTPHSASAVAAESTETAVLRHEDVTALVRRRPDIGVMLYRNVAAGLGRKLKRTDARGSDAT